MGCDALCEQGGGARAGGRRGDSEGHRLNGTGAGNGILQDRSLRQLAGAYRANADRIRKLNTIGDPLSQNGSYVDQFVEEGCSMHRQPEKNSSIYIYIYIYFKLLKCSLI